ncbi:Protein PNS1 [Zancudomyces culisetae]|uniref:Protein PNS1 n=1 Tax=Zancudomyces culisetae TaxID=1213189 RepID=A0A1R1PR49_ZANCU|nr:Protein PNS1 [Zancudomyces culisetae]OMH83352.1 Protein PNS1 [Zancudomyces culisetae]|eukprot:OMH78661.1 Protein PNS1 [Zancudomyces culisetae]
MVALIQTIRALLRNAMHSDDNNIVAVILFVCIDCILGCIESLLEMFNRYAYIEIAIYGKPFVQAAKDTLHLVKSKGIDALVNDILINNLVIMGSLVTGLVCGVLSYVAILIFESSAKSNTGFVVATIAAGFVVGFSIFLIIYGVLESGSSTVFVCLCEDPYSLARTKPELFNAIASTYPDVVQGLYTH